MELGAGGFRVQAVSPCQKSLDRPKCRVGICHCDYWLRSRMWAGVMTLCDGSNGFRD